MEISFFHIYLGTFHIHNVFEEMSLFKRKQQAVEKSFFHIYLGTFHYYAE
jgi:hypothetical protein